MRWLLFIFFCSSGNWLKAQCVPDTSMVSYFPVRQGILVKPLYRNYCHAIETPNIASVYSSSDSVFHCEAGLVKRIFNIGDAFAVLIENEKKEVIVYSNFESVKVVKGEFVHKDQYIGKLVKGEAGELNCLDILVYRNNQFLESDNLYLYILTTISTARQYHY